MGQITIRGLRTSTEMSSRGSEEATGMGGTGLTTGQSTRRPLPLCLRCCWGEGKVATLRSKSSLQPPV
jgi:hypothetical protein